MVEHRVDSSAIRTIVENVDGTVDVVFPNGSRYRYRGIPRSLVSSWVNASSVGAFFNKEIRDKFEYVALEN